MRNLFSIAVHAVLAMTLLVFSANTVYAQAACEELQTITHALRTAIYADGRQVQSTVTLPDQLGINERSPNTKLRYRIDVSACAPSGLAAVAIFRVGAPYHAQLVSSDGVAQNRMPWLPTPGLRDRFFIWIGDFAGGFSLNGRTPASFSLAANTLYLDISLLSATYIPSGLTLVQIGSTKHVGVLQEQNNLSQLYLSDVVAALSMFLAFLAVGLGLKRRGDMALHWFALCCLCWGPRSFLYLNSTLPGSGAWAELLISLVICFAGVSMLASTLYAFHAATPRMMRGLKGVLLGVSLVYVLALIWPVLAPLARVVSYASTATALGIGAELLRRSRSDVRGVSQRVKMLMVLGIWAQVLTGLFDFGITLGLRPPTAGVFAFWGFTAFVLALAVFTGARIVESLNRAENTNAELEQRVAEKNTELAQFYAQQRDTELLAEREGARQHERERLTREMHDGIGAQLMTALRGVERGAFDKVQVEKALQDGLDELRLLMDSSDVGRSLQGALAAWRNRWDSRLSAVGLQLLWQVDAGVEAVDLSEDAVLQCMRILQEAVTNTIKHANASKIDVRVLCDAGHLSIQIQDNGSGLSADLAAPDAGPTGGRGLRHIAHRASALGAQCEVRSLAAPAHGVCVRVSLPILKQHSA